MNTRTRSLLAAVVFVVSQAASAGDDPPALRLDTGNAREASHRPGAEIQLGAFRDQASALQGWRHIAAEVGPPLDALPPHIEQIDLPGKGRYWRLRLVFESLADAKAVCADLKSRGIDCLVARK